MKSYELTDHLGNVHVVLSDLRKADNGILKSQALAAYEYYPFGMILQKIEPSTGYRYGFNGKEKDSEWDGGGAMYDYGFRIYDPRIAKFLSVDPLSKKFPFYSPYQFAGNKPIWKIDLDGLEEADSDANKEDDENMKLVAENDKELKDFAGKVKNKMDQVKSITGKVDKLTDIAKAAEGVLNMESTLSPQEQLKRVTTLYTTLGSLMPKGTSVGAFIAQSEIVMPMIEHLIGVIAQGAMARSMEFGRIGFDEPMYKGAFPGGHELYDYMQDIKLIKDTYKDDQGNFSWGKYVEANNGNIKVPTAIQVFVKSNYDALSFLTGTQAPFKTETFMGVDFLAPDTDTGGGVHWFITNFETLETSLYGGLKVVSK